MSPRTWTLGDLFDSHLKAMCQLFQIEDALFAQPAAVDGWTVIQRFPSNASYCIAGATMNALEAKEITTGTKLAFIEYQDKNPHYLVPLHNEDSQWGALLLWNPKNEWTVETRDALAICQTSLEAIYRERFQQSNLAVTAAHDLRHPLGTIAAYCQAIEEGSFEAERQLEIIRIIRDIAGRAQGLADRMMSFGEIQPAVQLESNQKMRWGDLSQKLQEEYQPLADKKSIRLKVEGDADALIIGSETQAFTIMSNLLGNAIKFSKSKGRVVMFLAKEDGCNWLGVRDEGVGMSSQEVDSLLNRALAPLCKEGTEGEPSWGYGLKIIHEMLDHWGTQLEIESTPGKGSLFSFIVQLESEK